MGSTVISIRVPSHIKKEMDRLKGEINWSEEIREFIKQKIEEHKRKEALKKLVKVIEELPKTPKGYGAKLVRDDRDSH